MITAEALKNINETLKTVPITRKDKKGHEITKHYAPVTERVRAFRAICPQGSIITEVISQYDKEVVMKTTVKDEAGNILATGTAQEEKGSSFINSTSYIENCETSAVGRALAFLGIGVDESMASAEELANAVVNQEHISEKEKKLLETLVEKKGLDIEKTFPFGLNLTAEQYAEAMKKIGAMPDKKK